MYLASALAQYLKLRSRITDCAQSFPEHFSFQRIEVAHVRIQCQQDTEDCESECESEDSCETCHWTCLV